MPTQLGTLQSNANGFQDTATCPEHDCPSNRKGKSGKTQVANGLNSTPITLPDDSPTTLLPAAAPGNINLGTTKPATPKKSKPATIHTKLANRKFAATLDFGNTADFDDADRGLLLQEDIVDIKDAKDSTKSVWSLEQYKAFINDNAECPSTVNPSLFRNAELCLKNGLYEVVDGIYQVRGYDLSNITFVRGQTGWIVFDPLISEECAKAAYDLVESHFKLKRKVVAVVYSHSHIDHYGGAGGVISEEDAKSGKVKVLASEGFVEHAVSENVIAGNVMGRRAVFMYGSLLPKGAEGQVSSGLGMTTSTGTSGLIVPNDTISKTGETRTIDGVEMIFQFTPGTEAPTEMNTYFPDFDALWMAENATCTMHNLLTLRGALVRDPLMWASYLTETIDLSGKEAKVKFQSHHWPLWGKRKIQDYLKKQRDMYKYIHDQSVRLMNWGYIGSEISELLELPKDLYKDWHCRGYYGTMSHNSRAVYQRYMGWYSGNPSDLNSLPPTLAGPKYVEFMGGAEEVVRKARESYAAGEYRWVGMVLRHVVFSHPDNADAKKLLADAYEQMGYQAESGAWRAVYLQGAFELRNGVPTFATATQTVSESSINNMDVGMLLDYMGVRLNKDKAGDSKFTVQLVLTDLTDIYNLTLQNSVLSYSTAGTARLADVTVVTSKKILNKLLLGKLTLENAVARNLVSLSGTPEYFAELLGMIDTFDFWFNIITPHDYDNSMDIGNAEEVENNSRVLREGHLC